jgi:hypothetical protein
MPLLRAPDDRLYFDYHYYCDHFGSVVRRISPAPTGPLLYHSFWQGTLTWHHELSLKSLMVTQSGPFEVWLWASSETIAANESFLATLDDASFRVKPCDPAQLLRDTPLDGRLELFNRRLPAVSDAVRMVVLLKHGGIYFDLDVLFLRDLRELAGVDFIYQWSNQAYGNTAVSHFRRDSKNVQGLVARAATIGSCHPARLCDFNAIDPVVKDLQLWPVFVFDPAWLAHDTGVPINDYSHNLTDFFVREQPVSIETFYPSSYAYHWHNGWDYPLTEGSIAGQLYRQVRDRYAASRSRQRSVSP